MTVELWRCSDIHVWVMTVELWRCSDISMCGL